MPKCILHVGMHKTGSTSIQNSLAELDDEKFYYARIMGSPNHSVGMFGAFAERPDRGHVRKMMLRKKRTVDEIVGEAKRGIKASIAAAGERTLVISGEGMLRLNENDLKRLRKFFERHGYSEFEILAYIRPPGGYLSSAIQQRIKAGGFKDFRIEQSLPDYREKFEKFDQVFGAENVKLSKFDRALLKNGDVVEDFCERSGIPVDSIEITRKNEAVSRLTALLVYQYHRHCDVEQLPPLKAGQSPRLDELLKKLDPAKFKLTPDVLAPAIEKIKPDIEWMEKRLGQSLDEELGGNDELGIGSQADLMKPVEGINAKLRQVLAEAGVGLEEADQENTWKMIAALVWPLKEQLLRAKRNAAAVRGNDARAKGQSQRAPQGGNAGDDERSERRRLRRARRNGPEAGDAEGGKRGVEAQGGGMGQHAGEGISLDMDNGTSQGMRQGQGKGMGRGLRQGQVPGLGTGPHGPGAGRKGKGAGKKGGGAQLKPPKEVLQMPRANAKPDAPEGPRRQALTPITSPPIPLINVDKNLVVLWSPKSACTTVYVWFSYISGFAEDVRDYSTWPHRHRIEQYRRSDLYNESAVNGMGTAKFLRIIRDPYGRAVSIYRHALQTLFADKDMERYSNGKISAEEGYSFQSFLDMAATLDMPHVDIHFRPQVHVYESQRKADRVINISKQDLFTELNAFEADVGIPKTNFEDLDWLHELEGKRKAKQEPMKGEALDHFAFTRQQVKKLHEFPSYGQLLTPEAKQKIEAIYKADFDAYRDFL